MSHDEHDPLGLRPEPSSTGPKTGKAPPSTVGYQAGSGNVETDRRFGIPADRTTDRIITPDDRRQERKEAQE